MLVAFRSGMRRVPLVLAVLVLPAVTAEAEDLDLAPTLQADDSAAFGAFLPSVDAPARPATVVKTFGLYDGARDRPAYVIDAQARLSRRFQLQAGARYENEDLSSEASLQLGLLDGLIHGFDLQHALGYTERGINEVHAAFAELGVGRYHAGTYLFGTARFDLGLQDSERGGAIGLGSMTMIAPATYVGANGKLRLDLERDAVEPMDESTWSLQVGPALTYVIDRFAITASGGLAGDSPRMESRELGAFGSVGLGAAF
jgi:hypothetical protein